MYRSTFGELQRHFVQLDADMVSAGHIFYFYYLKKKSFRLLFIELIGLLGSNWVLIWSTQITTFCFNFFLKFCFARIYMLNKSGCEGWIYIYSGLYWFYLAKESIILITLITLIYLAKESERDMYEQRNEQLQTLIISSSVMFAAVCMYNSNRPNNPDNHNNPHFFLCHVCYSMYNPSNPSRPSNHHLHLYTCIYIANGIVGGGYFARRNWWMYITLITLITLGWSS